VGVSPYPSSSVAAETVEKCSVARGTAVAGAGIMRRMGFVLLLATGCTTTLDAPELRVEPAAVDLDVDLAELPPSIAFRVLAVDGDGERDVTADATFSLAGRPLGSFTGATLASDGRTGGVASVTVSFGAATLTVPVTAHVHGVRLVEGTPFDAPAQFAAIPDVDVDVALDPGDGTVLPPNLAGLDIDFAADPADTVHAIAVTAPFLDVRVYAPGVAGPRHVALTAAEWEAIARTASGEVVELAVRSTVAGGGAPAHRTAAQLAIADLDVSTLLFSGLTVDALGQPNAPPSLYRYAPRVGRVEPFGAVPGGGCMGCHIAISADGSRIAGAGSGVDGGPLVGVVFDAQTRAVLATSDPAQPWSTAAFDPSGALITSYQNDGNLYVRDAATAAVVATIPLGEPASSPAVSPDGSQLAYAVLDAPGNTFVGSALHVRSWDVATNTVGPPIELARNGGAMAPEFSPDGRWIAFSRTASPDSATTQGIDVVRADGSAPVVELMTGIEDGIPRFASPIAVARAGGAPEAMGWLAFSSGRAIGGAPIIGRQQQLWLAAFYPDRGVVARPFRLPGQDLALSALHAPVAVP
jgi:hypothetical protein